MGFGVFLVFPAALYLGKTILRDSVHLNCRLQVLAEWSVPHFLNRFRTSGTSEPVCDMELGFSQQHMCGTLKLFRYSCINVRNAIFRLIQKEETDGTGDCEWQVPFLQPFVHQGCASAVSV